MDVTVTVRTPAPDLKNTYDLQEMLLARSAQKAKRTAYRPEGGRALVASDPYVRTPAPR